MDKKLLKHLIKGFITNRLKVIDKKGEVDAIEVCPDELNSYILENLGVGVGDVYSVVNEINKTNSTRMIIVTGVSRSCTIPFMASKDAHSNNTGLGVIGNRFDSGNSKLKR